MVFAVLFMPVSYIFIATKAWRNGGGLRKTAGLPENAALCRNLPVPTGLCRQERHRCPVGVTLAVGWNGTAHRDADNQGTRMPQKRAFQQRPAGEEDDT